MKNESSPTTGMNWKEWKMKRKLEHQKWKQEKLLKKQKKAEEDNSKISKTSIETNAKTAEDRTVSIALPGSILDNAQTPELKCYVAGQIARAAAIFNVKEIVVFNDSGIPNLIEDDDQFLNLRKKNHGCAQMVKILEYLECPQYLRKYYFHIHKDLEFAGLLNPLDLPHHLRVDDESEFREGIVLDKPVKNGKGSYVYIGLPKTAVIDISLIPHIRVTVQLDKEQTSKKHYKGKAVSPYMPTRCSNLYWGYNVRFAKSLREVLSECPFKGGYDVTIGTSDKGSSVDSFKLPFFKRVLIVFGGLRGLEGCMDDETSDNPADMFQFYLNTCPNQGTRTIRTEEAVFVTLAALRPGFSTP